MTEFENEEMKREAFREETANLYLHDLDLSWEHLRGKRILDQGAGLADFAQVAKRHAVQVTSIEKSPDSWSSRGTPPTEVPYQIGDAKKLPFEAGSFDLIVSHAGPATIVDTLVDFQAILSEANRVLAPGGEFRFGPVWVNPAVFGWEHVLSDEESERLSENERYRLIDDRVFAFLRALDSRIDRVKSGQAIDRESPFDQYYVLRKPLEDAETPIHD